MLAAFAAHEHSVGNLYLEARREPDLNAGLGEQRAIRYPDSIIQRVGEISAGWLAKAVRFNVGGFLGSGYVIDLDRGDGRYPGKRGRLNRPKSARMNNGLPGHARPRRMKANA